jgi:hypothetical protein
MDFDPYSDEEKAKMLEENLEKGKTLSKMAAHKNLTNDHPPKEEPPARHKDEILKCKNADFGCDLSEDDMTDKLREIARAKEEAALVQRFINIDQMNQAKLY